MDWKDTQTAKNLRDALAGESIARNKYTYFALVARKNGHEKIAEAFEQMAQNEMIHARLWFEQLYGMPESSLECLMQAAHGEYSEWNQMYPDFARQARADGREDLAVMFERVAEIERSHENRFLLLVAELNASVKASTAEAAQTAPKQKKEGWRCQFCGAIFEQRPDVCDTCGAIGSFEHVEYFE